MKKISSKWFTLVELIVVITIMTILGTISFISVQGVIADARDTKRSSDLSNISKAINLSQIKGVGIRAFVDGTGATITWTWTGASGTRIRISWVEWYTALSSSYVAWDVSHQVLWMKEEEVNDPVETGTGYKIGATDYNGSFYELAATIENGGNPDTIVVGTWNPRNGGPSYSWSQNGGIFTLSDNLLASSTNLRVGDVVRFNSGSWAADIFTITRMNSNMVQVDRDTSASPGSTVFLHRTETKHLIKRWKSNSPIDIWAGSDYTPY